MAFDVGAGLSSMGTAVAATAGAMTLESQKAELEMEKVKLADQLAGARQEKQNVFTSSERVATQGFTSGENVLNRQSSLDIAKLTTAATVQAAGISAGATIQSANIHAQTVAKQMEQAAPLIAAQIKQAGAATEQEQTKTAGLVIGNSAAKEKEDAQKAYAEAGKSGDGAKIAEAAQRMAIANYSASEAAVNATTASTLAKLAADDLNRLRTEAGSVNNQAPETQAAFKAKIEQAETLYKSRMGAAVEAWKAVPKLPTPPGAGANAPPLSQLIPPPGTVTGTPVPGGMINGPREPGGVP